LRSEHVDLARLLAGDLDHPSAVGAPADGILPGEILPRLWDLIDELGVVHSVPMSNEWVRALHVPKGEPLSASRLGTAPNDHSTENRMNRAGEPMFYGAADDETAVLEIGKAKKGSQTAIGTWVPSRPLEVLDLVDLPVIPDFYDVEKAGLRWRLKFLSDFAADVSQPVAPHKRVEYRATQVFMDFLRSRPSEIDGIVYQSSRTGRACCALDVDNVDCVDAGASVAAGTGGLRLQLNEVRLRP
jgi:hypothetical protein